MFTSDVQLEGFTTEDWSRLLGLWQAPPPEDGAPSGGLIVIHGQDRVRKLLHTVKGRLDKDGETWPTPLATLAAKHGARWALAAPPGGLEKLAERFGARSRREHDLLAQAHLLLAIARELASEGVIQVWPLRLERLALPSNPVFTRTVDAVVPPEHYVVLAVFDEGELWTSVAIERGEGGIRRIVGPDELREQLTFLSGDFRRDYRHLVAEVERTLGPVAIGVFSDLSIVRELGRDLTLAHWLKALAVRDVIVTPMKGALAGPLLADLAALMRLAVHGLGKRWDSLDRVLSLWQRWR